MPGKGKMVYGFPRLDYSCQGMFPIFRKFGGHCQKIMFLPPWSLWSMMKLTFGLLFLVKIFFLITICVLTLYLLTYIFMGIYEFSNMHGQREKADLAFLVRRPMGERWSPASFLL